MIRTADNDELLDVLIIGGGPAGAITALSLLQRRRQHGLQGQLGRIVIVERDAFPRYKVCGCCLNGAALAVMAELDLADLPVRLGAQRLTSWQAAFARRHVHAKLPNGFALSRSAMDAALIETAKQRGVEVLQPASARILEHGPDHVRLAVKMGQQTDQRNLTARYVVLASGLAGGDYQQWLPWRSAPSGPIGAGTVLPAESEDYLAGVIYMACAEGGYVGIVRLEDGSLDVAAAMYEPAGKEKSVPLGVRAAGVLESAGMPLVAGLIDAKWKGTPQLHRQRVPGEGRILAVGDAAGYIEPFTGEGMAWAMQTGALAAEAIVESLLDRYNVEPNTGRWYANRYKRLFARRGLPCRLTSAALVRPWARKLVFQSLQQAPWLAKPVIRLINRQP